MKAKNPWVYLALLGAILFWSSVPLFLKYFTTRLDAWTVNGVRYGFAALLLLPAVFGYDESEMPGRNIWKDALIPSLVNVLGQVGWALAPYYIDASLMGFGIRSAFFFTLLTSLWLLPEERYLVRSPMFWGGAGLCVAGLCALFASSLIGARASPTGLIILFSTALIWGYYGVSVRKHMHGYSPHHSFGVICLYTAAVLVVLMALFGHGRAVLHMGGFPFTLLLVSALLGIAVAHILMYHVISRLGPLIESSGEFMTPFLTFTGAALLFGERLSFWQWIGGLGVICGSLLMVRTHRGAVETP
jgi:drug/metabolite transporter (DMT)-like permease